MKNKVTNLDIVVQVIGGKPYYSLKYKELGNNYFNVGYSSYSLENVIAWKNEYFDMIQQDEDDSWIPVDEKLPDPDKYILVSFFNYSIPMIGRYTVDDNDGGTFRVGDEDESFGEHGLYVNAWMPLPKCYKED
nr:MAG: Protein of unknown function (DUF551) [Bacteriophage sp.]